MKMIVVVALALVAATAALPVQDEPITIVRSSYDQGPNGEYNYGYETSNGISAEAIGQLKTVNDEENKPREVLVVRGQFSYLNSDGKPNIITYVADENGYRAQGDSIPKVVSRR